MRPQSYANHRAWPPRRFLAAWLIVAANVVVAVVLLIRTPGFATAWQALVATALLIIANAVRRNPQIVQDRVIRVEMQARLARVLPAERHGEIARLDLPRLIALRFAGDAELPGLVARALSGELATPDAIKRAIGDWQADWLRV